MGAESRGIQRRNTVRGMKHWVHRDFKKDVDINTRTQEIKSVQGDSPHITKERIRRQKVEEVGDLCTMAFLPQHIERGS